jgi:hypothetical protein
MELDNMGGGGGQQAQEDNLHNVRHPYERFEDELLCEVRFALLKY